MMSTPLERRDLINTQQMEVAINGPDGATHLILCSGITSLNPVHHGTYTFLVGPRLSKRQFVGAISSGAISAMQAFENNLREDGAETRLEANLVSISADYDDESSQVKVQVDVLTGSTVMKLAISYNVNILAELSTY